MAVKRGKKQARRKDEPRVPGIVWLLSGLLIGGAVAVAVWVKNPGAVKDLLPHPNPAAKPRLASAGDDADKVPVGNPPASSPASASTASDAGAAPKKPKYDFYTLLPEREVVIPDEELTAQVKAEQSANLAAKQQAALAAASSTASTPGAASANPVASTANAAATATTAQVSTSRANSGTTATTSNAEPPTAHGANSTAVATATPAASPAATSATAVSASVPVPAAQLKSGQYLLQAGAFRNTKQADDLKARIAMLGLIGRVETVDTPAGQMHRVRLGPYATASELEAAKDKLSSSGLPAVAIRVK